jgi:hypothetical protein
MKFFSKISTVTTILAASFVIGASGGGSKHHKQSFENLEDPNLNGKFIELKHKMQEQKAGITEATDLFKKVIPSALEGSGKVKRLLFEDGNTSVVITDSPLPIKILFKGQFLLDNQMLMDKVGKAIKFKVSNVELVEEPIANTLRVPFTDSKFWIHATFSNYGKVSDGDFIDSIKSGTIPY